MRPDDPNAGGASRKAIREEIDASLRRPAMTTTTKEHDMPGTEHDTTIAQWIAATNTHDSAAYLAFFTDAAVLDDPSVGEVFDVILTADDKIAHVRADLRR